MSNFDRKYLRVCDAVEGMEIELDTSWSAVVDTRFQRLEICEGYLVFGTLSGEQLIDDLEKDGYYVGVYAA